MSAAIAIIVGLFCAPANITLTLAAHPHADCELVAVDGFGKVEGIAIARCVYPSKCWNDPAHGELCYADAVSDVEVYVQLRDRGAQE